jgi:intein/homing endonuclease/superfamily II DNA or RNA helicase
MAEKFSQVPSCYPKLLEFRKSTTIQFKNNKYLKETTKLRYYQVIGALHMMLLNRMVLGDGTGLGKCVSENTYIPTTLGLIRIKDIVDRFMWNQDIKPGELYQLPSFLDILTINNKQKPSLYYSGYDNGLKIITDNGFKIDGLNHHPILVANELGYDFKKLEDIKIGEYACINRKGFFSEIEYWGNFNSDGINLKENKRTKPCKYPGYITENLAELIGFFISEGNQRCLQALTITQFEKEMNDRIRFLLEDCFNYKESGKNKDIEKSISINSINIINFFNFLGINTENLSGDKTVPISILMSDKITMRAFLRGYFEGDGSAEKGGFVSCSSKSEEMIHQIHLILLNFGIISKIKKKMVKVRDTRKPYWVLYMCGKDIDIFHKEIGFISIRKQNNLNGLINKIRNTNKDIIPFGNSMLKESMRDIIAHLKSLPEHHGFATKGSGWKGLVGLPNKRLFEAVIFNKRNLTYRTLNLFIEQIEKHKLCAYVKNYSLLKKVVSENFYFDKITTIENIHEKFYDFHVPEEHCFTGNGFINHNTIQSITAYTWTLTKEPSLKLIVVTIKSALFQWEEEVKKFTQGITTRVIVDKYKGLKGSKSRYEQYKDFKEDVLIINYEVLRNEYEIIKDCLGKNYMVIFDEATAFKNRKSVTFEACKHLAESASRVYGLSATVIKNSLEEVWSIYAIIVPGLFGNISLFGRTFCVTKLMKLRIKGKDRYIPKTVGYKNLNQFKSLIDPYILARKKEDVASELPKLISRKVILEMEPEQERLYKLALSGVIYEEKVKREFFEVYDQVRNGCEDKKVIDLYNVRKEKYETYLTEDGKKRGKLAALTYCQMISDGPSLVREKGESSKLIEFERILKEELISEKIIVYTRFIQAITDMKIVCDRLHIDYTEISGGVSSSEERDRNRLHFQNDQNCRIMFITTAGSASLNLQAAGVIIFYDTPWSYGDLVQTIGRAQRIGSIQEHILLLHFINKGTIDVRVMSKVSDKKDLSDDILGDTAKGALVFIEDDDTIDSLFRGILEDAETLDA